MVSQRCCVLYDVIWTYFCHFLRYAKFINKIVVVWTLVAQQLFAWPQHVLCRTTLLYKVVWLNCCPCGRTLTVHAVCYMIAHSAYYMVRMLCLLLPTLSMVWFHMYTFFDSYILIYHQVNLYLTLLTFHDKVQNFQKFYRSILKKITKFPFPYFDALCESDGFFFFFFFLANLEKCPNFKKSTKNPYIEQDLPKNPKWFGEAKWFPDWGINRQLWQPG